MTSPLSTDSTSTWRTCVDFLDRSDTQLSKYPLKLQAWTRRGNVLVFFVDEDNWFDISVSQADSGTLVVKHKTDYPLPTLSTRERSTNQRPMHPTKQKRDW
jgi:hypothetical protein